MAYIEFIYLKSERKAVIGKSFREHHYYTTVYVQCMLYKYTSVDELKLYSFIQQSKNYILRAR